MTKVMVFGTFDRFHPGHDSFLKQAKENGETLIVVVARDATVEKIKGKPPEQNERMRLRKVAEHPAVDEAVFGSLGTDKMEIIMATRPDIICLGYDQKAFVDVLHATLERERLDVKVMRCYAYHPHIYKSSKMRKS